MRKTFSHYGYTLVELLFVVSAGVTLASLVVPLAAGTVDDLRAAGAARHMAARIATLRLEAVRRAAVVALRFEPRGADYAFTTFLDGNSNGVRAADIRSGFDRAIAPADLLGNHFPGVTFGLRHGVPDLDGALSSGDGVRIGSTALLSSAPNGSCTSGTLYILGRRRQYAVRILGATGRVRLFAYEDGARQWIQK
jgi:type II secretory pathway pseudopilin PulG